MSVSYLRPSKVSKDTIKCLSVLQSKSQIGGVKGIAFVAYLEDGSYIADAAGDALKNPTLTRGMLLGLDAKLAQLIEGGTK